MLRRTSLAQQEIQQLCRSHRPNRPALTSCPPSPGHTAWSKGSEGWGEIRHHGIDEPVDSERPLSVFGSGQELPDVILVDQAQWIDEPLRLPTSAVRVRDGSCDDGQRRAAMPRSVERVQTIARTLTSRDTVDIPSRNLGWLVSR
jgi:hypothetical protein